MIFLPHFLCKENLNFCLDLRLWVLLKDGDKDASGSGTGGELKKTLASTTDAVDALYSGNTGTVDYATFKADPTSHENKTVLLQQSDFDSGTVRMRWSAKYKLTENISFEPNASDDHWPKCNGLGDFQEDYCDSSDGTVLPAYRMGFFAAATMETQHVVFDLNGFTMEASDVFALQMRFMSVVALTGQPFVGGQGPQPADAAGGMIGL